ncbi:MAG: hypothetical protein EOP04_30060 [Proteobacteria bacterium]|nr:MAG: hypothetical protein EOP04_30060 [Pseudomonadota bacterium]
MTKFKRLLSDTPVGVEKLFPGVPLPKAVELNRKLKHPLLKDNSVRNKLSTTDPDLNDKEAWPEEEVKKLKQSCTCRGLVQVRSSYLHKC